jgi:nucleotide-binding universal stress UspA family protein
MKVLLAIDSFPASHVVETAAARPWPSGTVFCVMSVVDMRHWKGLPALIEDATREAETVVNHAIQKLSESGHRAFAEIPQGSPKAVISDFAKQWNADLVMVGSHGHGAATRFLLGSTAQGVLHALPCTVEIVRARPASSSAAMKILLCTDGSKCSAKAVTLVANRPWPAGSEIRILSVVPLVVADAPSFVSSLRVPTPTSVDEITELGRGHAQQAIAEARSILSSTSLVVSDAAPPGEPRASILEEALQWGADLIVLGSHGRHGWEHFLLGSVAESVALYATCSVEVAR